MVGSVRENVPKEFKHEMTHACAIGYLISEITVNKHDNHLLVTFSLICRCLEKNARQKNQRTTLGDFRRRVLCDS